MAFFPNELTKGFNGLATENQKTLAVGQRYK